MPMGRNPDHRISPIYVAFDGADSWSIRAVQFDADNMPVAVAGCPLDGFQPRMKARGIPFMTGNTSRPVQVVDASAWLTVSISMTWCGWTISVGLMEYSIPYGDKTANTGTGRRAGNQDIRDHAAAVWRSDLPIIAEDLIPYPTVLKLVRTPGSPA